MIEAEKRGNLRGIEIKVNKEVVYGGGEGQTDNDLSVYNLMVRRDKEGQEWMTFEDEIVIVKFNGKVAKIQTTGNLCFCLF